MGKMNEALAKLIRERGLKKAEIARKLGGVTAQAVGNYAKKRGIPADFVAKWKAEYGDDLIALSETDVPHETKSKQATKTMDLDVWEVIKSSQKIFSLEFDRLWALIERFGPPAQTIAKDPVEKNGN